MEVGNGTILDLKGPKIYEKTFPEFKIYQGDDIRDFLKNIDVVLNVFSSTAVDALKYSIPVISITKFIICFGKVEIPSGALPGFPLNP